MSNNTVSISIAERMDLLQRFQTRAGPHHPAADAAGSPTAGGCALKIVGQNLTEIYLRFAAILVTIDNSLQASIHPRRKIFAEVVGMKQLYLATAVLLASAGVASADYVILVANVGADKELRTPGMGMAGGQMQGMQPGMNMRGGPGMGMAGGQMQGIQPGMGMAGGPPMGGMAGMGGGKGMVGGMMGMIGGGSAVITADDVPQFVIAIVPVKPQRTRANLFQELKDGKNVPVALPERLGQSCLLRQKPSFGEVFVIVESGSTDKALPTVLETFLAKFAEIKETSRVDEILRLAEWTLTHGLVDKFPLVMDKLIAVDKTHPAAVAYQKVKAELERKPTDEAEAASWRGKLLPGYKTIDSPHYLIVHNAQDDNAPELKTHANHLENSLRGYYYWFALKQTDPKQSLPSVPLHRQVVVLTRESKDFVHLHKILTSCPVVVDGFFARRENLSVMTTQRQDDSYESLTTFWETWSGKGFKRYDLLKAGKNGKPLLGNGLPPPLKNSLSNEEIADAQMLALMLIALEQEAELATVSHEASRQLLFSSGLLPRNVAVPEWILFGMGSFFETPLQSPWPTIGGLSPYYLPRWREMKDKSYEKKQVDTLRKVVTDAYFRDLPPNVKGDDAALRKARTAAWSLTYYLTQKHLDGLRRYFAELSKMPRDIELDDTVLLNCFARSFGCVDGNNKVDDGKLTTLARSWYAYWENVKFESEGSMKDMRDKIAKKIKEAEDMAKKANENANQGTGQFPGGMPGGFGPGGPGGFGPGGPQGGPQQGGRFPPNNGGGGGRGGRPNPRPGK